MDMDKKDTFVLYTSFYDSFEKFSTEDKALMLDAIFLYQKTGTIPENLSPVVDAVFPMIKKQMDLNAAKYAKQCEINAQNAQKGWEKRKQQSTNEIDGMRPHTNESDGIQSQASECEAMHNDTDSVSDNDSDSVSENGGGYDPLLPPPTKPPDDRPRNIVRMPDTIETLQTWDDACAVFEQELNINHGDRKRNLEKILCSFSPAYFLQSCRNKKNSDNFRDQETKDIDWMIDYWKGQERVSYWHDPPVNGKAQTQDESFLDEIAEANGYDRKRVAR